MISFGWFELFLLQNWQKLWWKRSKTKIHIVYKPFLLFLWDWVWKNAASHSSWCGEVKNGWWRVLFELGEKSPRVLGRRPHNAREKETMLNETNIKTINLFLENVFLSLQLAKRVVHEIKRSKSKNGRSNFYFVQRVCVWSSDNHEILVIIIITII